MTSPAEIALEIPFEDPSRGGQAGEVAGSEDRRAAFLRLADEHLDVVHGLARRLAARPEDAEDLVQETFLRAWRGLYRFRREAELKTWLYRILVNVSRDRGRRARLALRPAAVRLPPPDPSADASRRDLVDRAFEAIDRLPPRQRECLLLRVRVGLGYREIGSLMGIRPGAVKSHLAQARRRLVRELGNDVGKEGSVSA